MKNLKQYLSTAGIILALALGVTGLFFPQQTLQGLGAATNAVTSYAKLAGTNTWTGSNTFNGTTTLATTTFNVAPLIGTTSTAGLTSGASTTLHYHPSVKFSGTISISAGFSTTTYTTGFTPHKITAISVAGGKATSNGFWINGSGALSTYISFNNNGGVYSSGVSGNLINSSIGTSSFNDTYANITTVSSTGFSLQSYGGSGTSNADYILIAE